MLTLNSKHGKHENKSKSASITKGEDKIGNGSEDIGDKMANIDSKNDIEGKVNLTFPPATAAMQLKALLLKQFQQDMKSKGITFLRLFLSSFFLLLFGNSSIYNTVPNRSDLAGTGFTILEPKSFNFSDVSLDAILSQENYPPDFLLEKSSESFTFKWATNTSRIYVSGTNFSDVSNLIGLSEAFGDELSLVNIEDPETFLSFCLGQNELRRLLACVYFEALSPSWNYKIFIDGNFTLNFFMNNQDTRNQFIKIADSLDNRFVTSGFFTVDSLVKQIILQNELSEPDVTNLPVIFNTVQALPVKKPTFERSLENDFSIWGLAINLALALQFSMVFYFNAIHDEKKSNIRRGFFLFGVSSQTYYLHWFIYFGLGAIISSITLTAVFFGMQMVAFSNPFLVFIFMLLNNLGLLAFALVFSGILKDADSASLVGFLVSIFCGAIFLVLLIEDASVILQSILTLICPIFGLYQGSVTFQKGDYIGNSLGIQFGNVVSTGFLQLFFAQLAAVIVWTYAGIYYRFDDENTKGKLKRMLRWQKGRVEVEKAEDFRTKEPMEGSRYLDEPNDPIFKVRNIYKEFGDVKALNGLTFDVGRGRVYGFLGHNGSGKTTFISILSGEIPPTEGNIYYDFPYDGKHFSLNSLSNTVEIKSRIGVCPQENILMNNLTCREHLRLFCKLKGRIPKLSPEHSFDEALDCEVNRIMDILGTANVDGKKKDDFEDKIVKDFSGGMKRRLTLLMSLIGDPDILLLDEPTSGIDIYNKSLMYNLINSIKREKCILITTHFMDEADLLSDEILILNKGKLVANGTPLFLKHKFGTGYTLTLETSAKSPEFNEIQKEVQKIVKEARFEKKVDAMYYFKLSYNEREFPKLISHLTDLHCRNITLNLTTLEEVFMKTGMEGLEDIEKEKAEVIEPKIPYEEHLDEVWLPQEKNHSPMRKIWALSVGLIKSELRQPEYVVFNIVMPITFLVVAFALGRFLENPLASKDDVQNSTNSFVLQPIVTSLVTKNYDNTPFFFENNAPFPLEPFFNGISVVSQPYSASIILNDNVEFSGGIDSEILFFNSSVEASLPVGHNEVFRAYIADITSNSTSVESSVVFFNYGANNVNIVFNPINLLVPLLSNMGFVPLAYCIMSIVRLKEAKNMLMLNIMGMNNLQIFLSVILSRATFVFTPTFIFTIVIAFAFDSPVVGNGLRWLAFMLLMLAYCFSTIPLALLFEPFFQSAKVTENAFPAFWQILNIVPFIVYYIYASSLKPSDQDTANLISDIFIYLPGFAYQNAMFGFLFLSDAILQLKQQGIDLSAEEIRDLVWEKDSIVVESLWKMFASGCLFWLLMVTVAVRGDRRKIRNYLRYMFYGNRKDPARVSSDLENDLKPALEVNNLSKHFSVVPEKLKNSIGYNTRYFNCLYVSLRLIGYDYFSTQLKQKQAIEGVSFNVRSGEIFVLIGPSAAGKTVAFKSIIGEIHPDSGNVFINGTLISFSDYEDYFANGYFGYCPQFDSLFENLSVEEYVTMISKVRGLSYDKNNIHNQPNLLVKMLRLDMHIKKKTTDLSGGFKRKISFLTAILSSPKIVVMDEPSTGLDPAARKNLWKILDPVSKGAVGREMPAIVLSTHDMNEAEAVADQLGVVIDGKLRAKGTVSELLEKYCAFIFVEINFPNQKPERLLSALATAFPEKEILEEMSGKIKFKVPHNSVSGSVALQVASTFNLMEGIKEEGLVTYYSVTQMNLEQVFMTLVSTPQRTG